MALSAKRIFPRVSQAESVLLVCDMQEKFRSHVKFFPEIVKVCRRMIQAATLLDMKIVATEQYPKGLGHTAAELELNKYNVPVYEKMKFSMCIPSLVEFIGHRKSIILCGIEAHICVLQTALDLLEKNIDVHVVADAVSSRSQTDRFFGLRQLEKAGAVITTSECVFLQLLRGADHPHFRDVQKLFLSTVTDTGLCNFP